ncbi:MAG: hypothetical protein CVU64_14800 [Deltaproteobacteria bacterium HGW-Deltaproteobacteria-21]|nr:MAG: hypothetical protein CVU64_14800 [Deltaproteobacteria bacterium HGW-Deltaproteobacteria-21]
MDEIRTLKAQMKSLLENLIRAKKAMAAARINPRLLDAVEHRFEWKARESKEQLEALEKKIDIGKSIEECWKEFGALRKSLDEHFRECLAFLGGALIRSEGLDSRLCVVADAILWKLSHNVDCEWTRFTIMADVDLFADMSEIIRLRFPEFSIWHLPIVAHELGHFVADKLDRDARLFAGLMEKEDLGACSVSTLHEQFADVFAVNALGPAYACSCIFLEFDPTRIYEGGSGHPPDYERVHLIIRSLKTIDEKNQRGDYAPSIDALNSLWHCSMKACKKQGSLTSEHAARLDNRLDRIFGHKGVGSRLKNIRYNNEPRYDRWPQASLLSTQLELQTVEDIFNVPGRKFILRDVLNAAWQWRLWHPGENYGPVGQKALDLCLKMIESGKFEV